MKTKTVLGCLILSVMLCHSSLGIVASEISHPGSTDLNEPDEPKKLSVLIQDSDGNVREEIFDPNEATYSSADDSYSPDPYLIDCSQYDPNNWQEGISPLSVDKDGREKQTKVNPAIGFLLCGFDSDGDSIADKFFYGTASLQSHDVAISCAHVVFKKCYADYGNKWAVSIRFYAGMNGEFIYTDYADKTDLIISTAYTKNTEVVTVAGQKEDKPDLQEDWSIITLNKDLGSKFGWFGLRLCTSSNKNLEVAMEGYPADKGSYYPWFSRGIITGIDKNIVKTNLYSTSGFSGAPIINSGNVYGIMTHHSKKDNRDSGGTRIDDTLYTYIVNRRKASEERWKT